MQKELKEKLQKYQDLVAYCRKRPEDLQFPLVQELHDRVNQNYKEELDALSGPNAEWEHGFNHGCLAILRYIESIEEDGIDFANDQFPMLDT